MEHASVQIRMAEYTGQATASLWMTEPMLAFVTQSRKQSVRDRESDWLPWSTIRAIAFFDIEWDPWQFTAPAHSDFSTILDGVLALEASCPTLRRNRGWPCVLLRLRDIARALC